MRPNAPLVAGVALVVLGTLGYVIGTVAVYPGRSFAVTGATVGIALFAVGIGRATADDDDGPEALRAAKAATGTTWVRVAEATDGRFERVAEAFGIHPLVVEDVRSDVRPKAEEFADYTFTLVKDAEPRKGEGTFDEEVRTESVGVVFGQDWVVTLSGSRADAVARVWRAAERGDERLLERGPDFTAYRIVDVLVDEYFEILDAIGTQIEVIEEAVTESTDIAILDGINSFRRDLLAFRKIAWPAREATNVLSRGDPRHVRPETESTGGTSTTTWCRPST
jgi:magnesium transporter